MKFLRNFRKNVLPQCPQCNATLMCVNSDVIVMCSVLTVSALMEVCVCLCLNYMSVYIIIYLHSSSNPSCCRSYNHRGSAAQSRYTRRRRPRRGGGGGWRGRAGPRGGRDRQLPLEQGLGLELGVRPRLPDLQHAALLHAGLAAAAAGAEQAAEEEPEAGQGGAARRRRQEELRLARALPQQLRGQVRRRRGRGGGRHPGRGSSSVPLQEAVHSVQAGEGRGHTHAADCDADSAPIYPVHLQYLRFTCHMSPCALMHYGL